MLKIILKWVIHFLTGMIYCPHMENTFADLHRVLTDSQSFQERATVAGFTLGLLNWLATGFMLGFGMTLGQVLAG
jgi:hypothetical protein